MDKYEVIFYETEDGTKPAYDFIETYPRRCRPRYIK